MYTRTDDDILPAGRRRGATRVRAETRPGKAPAHRRPPRVRADTRPAPEPAPEPAPVAPERSRRLRRARPEPVVVAPARTGRARSALVEVLLTFGALVGVAVAGATVFATQTGLRPLVVRSGSMEPTIRTGSMVLVRRIAVAEIRPGDVVAVDRADHTRVIHRVVEIERHGEVAELTLKGDANEDPDPAPVPVRHAYRLAYHVPELGRVGAELATPRGAFLLGCLLTAVVTRLARRRPRPTPADGDG